VRQAQFHYESGKRSGAWLKYKINQITGVLVGYTPASARCGNRRFRRKLLLT
jgi:hypothetical protein